MALNYKKNNFNPRINFLKHNLKLIILKEDENFLHQIKNKKFIYKISKTELNLAKKNYNLKPLNPEHNLFNQKILNQIKTISNKIYKDKSQEKKTKMLHDILYSEQKNNNNNNFNNNLKNKDNNNNNEFKNNSVHKISNKDNKNINHINKKDIIKVNNSYSNKNNYNSIKTNNNEKLFLPPIHQFKYSVKKLKLNINNETNDDNEEKMMKLYKELEFRGKNKFVV